MPNYQNGKIYKLVSNLTDKIYIGSTSQSLSQRMGGHIKDYKFKNKYVSSSILIEYGDAKPILIKNYPCNSREELEAEERVYIEKMKCVNKYIPTRTKSEYYQDKKEQIKQYQQRFNQVNKERLIERQKTHYHNNKERLIDYQKTYRQNNPLKIAEKKRHYSYWCRNKQLFHIIKPLFDDI